MMTTENSTTEYTHLYKNDSSIPSGTMCVIIDNINGTWEMELTYNGVNFRVDDREFIENLKEFLNQAQKIN